MWEWRDIEIGGGYVVRKKICVHCGEPKELWGCECHGWPEPGFEKPKDAPDCPSGYKQFSEPQPGREDLLLWEEL